MPAGRRKVEPLAPAMLGTYTHFTWMPPSPDFQADSHPASEAQPEAFTAGLPSHTVPCAAPSARLSVSRARWAEPMLLTVALPLLCAPTLCPELIPLSSTALQGQGQLCLLNEWSQEPGGSLGGW